MAKTPPSLATPNFQTKTMAPPETIPARAPHLLQRFQNRERIITGPKVAPKPAQAKETTRKMELVGSLAKITPRMATPTTVRRAMSIAFLSLSLMPSTSLMILWVTPEAAASSCASAVDMVAARIPAMMMPAMMAGRTPTWARAWEALTIMFSAADWLSGMAMTPALAMLKPTMPMTTAMPREITTQTEPTRRESFSLVSSPMAMKCSRMWGIPK